ncbi:MAG: hypothetical protein DRQ51_10600 [Gammaproteobacteria bacterium]|nr:MAG: hypothetical protein DRQ51_10600 [Gammaproteobacteria bacterium]
MDFKTRFTDLIITIADRFNNLIVDDMGNVVKKPDPVSLTFEQKQQAKLKDLKLQKAIYVDDNWTDNANAIADGIALSLISTDRVLTQNEQARKVQILLRLHWLYKINAIYTGYVIAINNATTAAHLDNIIYDFST